MFISQIPLFLVHFSMSVRFFSLRVFSSHFSSHFRQLFLLQVQTNLLIPLLAFFYCVSYKCSSFFLSQGWYLLIPPPAIFCSVSYKWSIFLSNVLRWSMSCPVLMSQCCYRLSCFADGPGWFMGCPCLAVTFLLSPTLFYCHPAVISYLILLSFSRTL